MKRSRILVVSPGVVNHRIFFSLRVFKTKCYYHFKPSRFVLGLHYKNKKNDLISVLRSIF